MRNLSLFLIIFYSACTLPEKDKANQLSQKKDTTVIKNVDANAAASDTFNSMVLPIVKKMQLPDGIYQTVLPIHDKLEQTVAFNSDLTFQLQEKYSNKGEDSTVIIEGTWTPSDGYIWLYKDQVVRGRYKWSGKTFQYYSPVLKKNFSMKHLEDAAQNVAWKNKAKEGVVFFGMGNEPFWNIEIDNTDSISFLLPDWNQPLRMKVDSSFKANEANSYMAHNDSVKIHVTISPQFCNDGMSDFIYRNKIKVQYNQQVFNGCGIVYKQ